jgi:dTDP-4-amino-4,6-dideoxygalactose transaminase
MIRLAKPSIDENDINAIANVLRTGFLIQGAKVAEFEKATNGYIQAKHCIAVNNCTTALQLSLLALDVRPGDLVLVTAYSWLSTANVIELCGAIPVFVDINPDTFNMDSKQLEALLTRLKKNRTIYGRVKAVIPVHTFGLMADMFAINEIADRYNLPVIEDAACAFGAKQKGMHAGSIGKLGCFSFHPRKAITTGEGGLVVTDDETLANKIRALRNHGIEMINGKAEFTMPGFNFRMTEFQAAFGLVQLQKFERITNSRKKIAAKYTSCLASSELEFQKVAPEFEHVYQSFITLLPAAIMDRRDEIIQSMKKKDIEVQIGTWHMPLTQYYRTRYGYKDGDFPHTDRVFKTSISLPLHEDLTDQNIELVCHELKNELH